MINKLIILLLLSSTTLGAQTIDKIQAAQFNVQAKSYKDKIRNENPDRAVVFISNRLNTKYLDLIEVDIDKSDMVNRNLRFNRPLSSKKKEINECKSEFGQVTFNNDYIIVSQVTKFPVRVRCLGDGGNYREVFATFKQ
jgi:hypothetical protein